MMHRACPWATAWALAGTLAASPAGALPNLRFAVGAGGGMVGSAGLGTRIGPYGSLRVDSPLRSRLFVGLESSATRVTGRGVGNLGGATLTTSSPATAFALLACVRLEARRPGAWSPYLVTATGAAWMRVGDSSVWYDPAGPTGSPDHTIPAHTVAAWSSGVCAGLYSPGRSPWPGLDFDVQHQVLVGPDHLQVLRAQLGMVF